MACDIIANKWLREKAYQLIMDSSSSDYIAKEIALLLDVKNM